MKRGDGPVPSVEVQFVCIKETALTVEVENNSEIEILYKKSYFYKKNYFYKA